MLHTALMIIQVFSSVAIIALVLIQRGKGSDAGAGFGAGASGTVFGARGARTGLSRATAVFAAVFMVISLLLAYTGQKRVNDPGKSVFDEVGQQMPAPQPAGAPTVPSIPTEPPVPQIPEAPTP